jgi:hypothetical protein
MHEASYIARSIAEFAAVGTFVFALFLWTGVV